MKVTGLNVKELKELIQSAVYLAMTEALLDFFGDPDDGLQFQKQVKERLKASLRMTKEGEQGFTIEQVRRRLEL